MLDVSCLTTGFGMVCAVGNSTASGISPAVCNHAFRAALPQSSSRFGKETHHVHLQFTRTGQRPHRAKTALALAALSLIGLIATRPAAAQTIVAPNAFATTNGGYVASTAPFDDVSRYQQIYAASQFSTLSGPELITQIAFRPGVIQQAFTHTDSHIQFDFSTNTEAVNSMSSTFANNVGGNDQVVYNAGLTFSSAGTSSSGGGPLDLVVKLTTPFLYNPAAGNLVLDIRNFAPAFMGYVDIAPDPATHLFWVDNSTTAATGTLGVGNAGIVTQFTFAPVPEASTTVSFGLLLAFGIGGLAIARRRKASASAE